MDNRQNSIRIEWVAIELIHPDPKQLRHHSRSQLSKIESRLKLTGGQVHPLIVVPDAAGGFTIVDGNAEHAVLQARGERSALAAILANQSEADIKALRLLLNRIVQDTKWDNARLAAEFQQLIEINYDLALTGFDPPEIDFLLKLDIPEAGVLESAEAIPAVSEIAIARLGDVYQLGDHRVGCGDARDARFVEHVLQGRLASLAFTDPPYNLKVDGVISGKGANSHREFVQGSGEMSEEEFFAFLRDALLVLKDASAPSALAFVCMDWRHHLELGAAGRAVGMGLNNVCIWTKSNPGMGGLYRNAYEMVFVFKTGTEPHLNNVELGRFGRNRTNVWAHPGMSSFGADRDQLLKLHPTVKPVALISDVLKDATRRRGVVLDTFLGSGSTVIAAEETGRVCCGVELDPLYLDVVIRRWQSVTGRNAVLAGTSDTFNDRATRLLRKSEGTDEH